MRAWWLVAVGCSEYRVNQEASKVGPTDTGSVGGTTPTTPSTPPPPPPTLDSGTPPEPIATAPVYAHTSTELYEIDPATASRTLVGSFSEAGVRVTGMVDIAIDLQGHLYGGTFDQLYAIDPVTAEVASLCPLVEAPTALTFTSDGVLFAGTGARILALDVASCTASALVDGSSYTTSGDLVGLPDGFLYWTVWGGLVDDLVRVDPVTGDTTWIGPAGESSLYGLGYDQGNLYGFSEGGAIVRIDPATAAATTIHDDGTSWWGATTNPVLW